MIHDLQNPEPQGAPRFQCSEPGIEQSYLSTEFLVTKYKVDTSTKKSLMAKVYEH